MDEKIKARLEAAVREACITDDCHPLIVRAAEVMDICELWRQLSYLDAPNLDDRYRSMCEALSDPEDVTAAEKEMAAIVELSSLRELSFYPFSEERELQDLLSRLESELFARVREARRRAQMLDDSIEAKRQSLLEKPQGPRSPAGRRREYLVPVVLELRKHEWSFEEIAALVTGEVIEEDGAKDLWLSHPCPETRDFWTDWEDGNDPDLIQQLRQDIKRANRRDNLSA